MYDVLYVICIHAYSVCRHFTAENHKLDGMHVCSTASTHAWKVFCNSGFGRQTPTTHRQLPESQCKIGNYFTYEL